MRKKPITPKENPADEGDAAVLAQARLFRNSPRERREKSCLYRWAGLVLQRNKAGRPIAKQKEWLDNILVGFDPEESAEMFPD